jgi:RNA polymerase sigma factor (sigma-70 family)
MTANSLRMSEDEDELLPTRASLISRLKNWQDQKSWERFFNTYWRLIYGLARKTGLSDAEAQDVVQETMAAAAKHLPGFNYDPKIGSFKGWLLHTTRWKIIDQFRKRGPVGYPPCRSSETSMGTDPIHAIPDNSPSPQQKIRDAEWEKKAFEVALAQVKERVDPQKYEIFDLYVNQGWKPERLAAVFQISIDQVYLIKHRLTDLIREEVKRLENEML